MSDSPEAVAEFDKLQALYDALLSESGAELPRDDATWARAVRVASMKVKRDDPSADWASLRLLVP